MINEPLVVSGSILLSPLHINLGFIKHFLEVLDTNGNCIKYIRSKFSGASYEKVRAGIFDEPQHRKLTKDLRLVSHITVVESASWCSFVFVVKQIFWKNKGKLLPGHNETDAVKIFKILEPEWALTFSTYSAT